MELSARARWQGHAAMLAFSACVAGSFSLGAMAAPEIAPLAINVPRFLLAAALMGALAAAAPRGIPAATFRAPWRYLVLGGIFAFYFWAMLEGLKTAPAISASAIFTLTPLMSGVFAIVLLSQVLTRRIVAALALGGAGALWVIFRGDPAALAALDLGRGEAIYLVGCVAHALYTPLLVRLGRGEPPFAFVFCILVACTGVMAVLGWRQLAQTEWAALPAIVWTAIVYLAVFAGAASSTLLTFAAQRLPSSKVMAYTYLVPSWVIGWELALGHGGPAAVTLVGVAMTAAALAMLLREEEGTRRASAGLANTTNEGPS